jgi:hypothetical protein
MGRNSYYVDGTIHVLLVRLVREFSHFPHSSITDNYSSPANYLAAMCENYPRYFNWIDFQALQFQTWDSKWPAYARYYPITEKEIDAVNAVQWKLKGQLAKEAWVPVKRESDSISPLELQYAQKILTEVISVGLAPTDEKAYRIFIDKQDSIKFFTCSCPPYTIFDQLSTTWPEFTLKFQFIHSKNAFVGEFIYKNGEVLSDQDNAEGAFKNKILDECGYEQDEKEYLSPRHRVVEEI